MIIKHYTVSGLFSANESYLSEFIESFTEIFEMFSNAVIITVAVDDDKIRGVGISEPIEEGYFSLNDITVFDVMYMDWLEVEILREIKIYIEKYKKSFLTISQERCDLLRIALQLQEMEEAIA